MQIIILPLWFLHIPFVVSENVLKTFDLNDNAMLLSKQFVILIPLMLYSIFVVSMEIIHSRWNYILWLRICIKIAINSAFIFVWLINCTVASIFHDKYYKAAHCKEVPHGVCQKFPVEIDIAYLFYVLPMFFVLVLIWIFIFYNKIISPDNNIWFFIFLCINALSIFIHYGGNGVNLLYS